MSRWLDLLFSTRKRHSSLPNADLAESANTCGEEETKAAPSTLAFWRLFYPDRRCNRCQPLQRLARVIRVDGSKHSVVSYSAASAMPSSECDRRALRECLEALHALYVISLGLARTVTDREPLLAEKPLDSLIRGSVRATLRSMHSASRGRPSGVHPVPWHSVARGAADHRQL
jgi:hypothetical protein